MSAIIEVGVPGLKRDTINLHELPTKKGGTWFALAAMRDGEKVALHKGAEFAADEPQELPTMYSVGGEIVEAKLGTTRNGKPKSYASVLVTLDDGRRVRVLVQASTTSGGYWIYTNGHPANNGVSEADIL